MHPPSSTPTTFSINRTKMIFMTFHPKYNHPPLQPNMIFIHHCQSNNPLRRLLLNRRQNIHLFSYSLHLVIYPYLNYNTFSQNLEQRYYLFYFFSIQYNFLNLLNYIFSFVKWICFVIIQIFLSRVCSCIPWRIYIIRYLLLGDNLYPLNRWS